ncbi:MAG: phosphonate-binding protein, partial [Brevundimonas sp.]
IVNTDPFSPRVRLIGDLGPPPARDRAQRRIEASLASEAGRALRDLRRLKSAVESGALKGLPRGIAFRLLEAGGLIDRRDVERDLAALSQVERRTIKAFAIRVGTHSVWLPGALKPRGRALSQAFAAAEPFRARPTGLSLLPIPAPSPRALSAFGVRAAGRWAVPVEDLERASDSRRENKGNLSDEALKSLGWTAGDARAIWTALKTVRAQMPDREGRPIAIRPDSPFAKLAELTARPEPARRRRPKRKKAG